MQQIFKKKTLESFFFEGAEIVAGADIKQRNQYQPGIEDTDTGKVAEWPKVGYPIDRIVVHAYRDIPYSNTSPRCFDNYFYFELKLRCIEAGVLQLF